MAVATLFQVHLDSSDKLHVKWTQNLFRSKWMGNHLWTTLSSVSTSGMFKHFIGGLIITVTARSVCLLLFPGTVFLFSAQSCSRVLLPGLEAACSSRLTHFPSVPWVQKSHYTGTMGGERAVVSHSRWGDVLGRGKTTDKATYRHIPESTSFSHFISLALQKLQETAWFSFWLSAVLGAGSDSGLPRQGSFLSAGKIDQHLSLHTAVSQTPKGLFILWH